MADRSIMVRLGLNVADFKAGAASAGNSLEDLVKKGDKTATVAETGLGRMGQSVRLQGASWQAMGGHLTKVGAAQTALAGAVAVTGANYNILQQTSRAALTTLVGGVQAANKQMDELDAFAKTSPFSKATFIEGQQQLIAFGVEAQRVVPYLDAVQNAVAAAGGNDTSLRGIIEIMAKIQSSAKITGQDLMQFGNWGVDAAGLIGLAMGKTGNQIRTEITAGTLDATTALDALAQGMQTRFGGASANIKEQMVGALDRVKAAWRDVSAELMAPLISPQGGGLLVDLTNKAADFMRAFQKLPQPVKDFSFALLTASAAVNLAGGGFMLAMPRLLEFQKTLTTLGSAGVPVISRMAASMASAGPLMGTAAQQAARGFAQLGVEMKMAATLSQVNMRAISAGGKVSMDGLKTATASAATAATWHLKALGTGGAQALKGLGSAAKTAGSAVVGALGGWPTIAAVAGIAGVTTAIMTFQRRAQEAKQAARALIDTLDEVTKAGTIDTKKWAIDEIIDREGLEVWKRAGQDLGAVSDAVANMDAAKIREMGEAFGSSAEYWANGPMDAYRISGTYEHLARSVEKANATAEITGDVLADTAGSADGLAGAVDGAADSMAEATESTQAFLGALRDLKSFQDGYASSVETANKAQRDWLDTLDDANAVLEKNGKNWDLSTTAGRENQEMVDKLGSAWRTNVDAMIAATDANGNMVYSLEEVQAFASSGYDQFISLATALGASDEEARTLAANLGLIPEDVESSYRLHAAEAQAALDEILAKFGEIPVEVATGILAYGDEALVVAEAVQAALIANVPLERITEILARDHGATRTAQLVYREIDRLPAEKSSTIKVDDQASSKLSNIRGMIAAIQSKTIAIHTNYTNSGSPQMGQQVKAMGGAIHGAGSGTSDEIPIWASNGEHMWTASEVNAVGGHQAVYQVRSMARSGYLKATLGLAGGGGLEAGAVVPQTRFATQPSAPPSLNIEVQAFVENPFTGEEIEARMARTVVKYV